MQAEGPKKTRKNKAKNILFTVAYYNVLEFPMTTFEVWRYLIDFRHKRNSCPLDETAEILEELKKRGLAENVMGFWVLPGKENLAEQRIKNQKISVTKIQRLQKWLKFARFLPYIRGIFITGALAMKRATPKSDWDVLVVVKKKRIWVGRLFITLFFQFLGKRRHDAKINNRFCLNHFLTEDGLILEENNEFSSNELVFAIPVYGKEAYQRFQQLNEHQINFIRPNYQRDTIENYFLLEENKFGESLKRKTENFLEWLKIGSGLNRLCKNLMIKKIKKNPKTYLSGSDIRYNDQALVFLPVPKRRNVLLETAELFKSFASWIQ